MLACGLFVTKRSCETESRAGHSKHEIAVACILHNLPGIATSHSHSPLGHVTLLCLHVP
jgi:hypothetical protein